MTFTVADADVFVDGFDHLGAIPSASIKWTTGALLSSTAGTPFSFGRSARVNQSATKLLTAQTVWNFLSYWMMQAGSTASICQIQESGATLFTLKYNTSNFKFEFYRGTSTLLGSSTNTFSTGIWRHLEFFVTLDSGSSGSCQLWVDGVSEINLSGIQTATASTGDRFTLAGASSSVHSYDELVVRAGSGAWDAADKLGLKRVYTLWPDGDSLGGAGYKMFAPSPAVDNYLNADETDFDSDTTYNDGAAVDDIDAYAMQDPPASTTNVSIVQLTNIVKESAPYASGQKVRNLWRCGTDAAPATLADTLQGADFPLPASYIGNREARQLNPNGATAWTLTIVNNMEAGLKRTA